MLDYLYYQREENAWKQRIVLAMARILVQVRSELSPNAPPETVDSLVERFEKAQDLLRHIRFPTGHRFTDWLWSQAKLFTDQWTNVEDAPDQSTLEYWTGNRLLECIAYVLFEAPEGKWPDISGALGPELVSTFEQYARAHEAAMKTLDSDETRH